MMIHLLAKMGLKHYGHSSKPRHEGLHEAHLHFWVCPQKN